MPRNSRKTPLVLLSFVVASDTLNIPHLLSKRKRVSLSYYLWGGGVLFRVRLMNISSECTRFISRNVAGGTACTSALDSARRRRARGNKLYFAKQLYYQFGERGKFLKHSARTPTARDISQKVSSRLFISVLSFFSCYFFFFCFIILYSSNRPRKNFV